MPATWQGNAIVLCTAVAASLGALLTWSGTRGARSVRDFVSHDGDTLFGSKLGLPGSRWVPEFSIPELAYEEKNDVSGQRTLCLLVAASREI
jgi:hypothetical protein